MKPTAINPQAHNTTDRYAILQRKVDDLERLHNNDKKAASTSFLPLVPFATNPCLIQHQTEVNHLKVELARVQKSNADLTDRSDKLRKHNKVLDLCVQDLKKAASSDQAEIKDLRVKLKMLEHEKPQLSDIKNSLQSLESRRREEVRERDRRIADLEKAVAGERKKREAAETKYLELKSKCDQDFASSREATHKLEALVNTAQASTLDAQRTLSSLKVQSECHEQALLVQLEQYQLLLRQVAGEYGCLVSRTVPISDHTQLKLEYTTLLAHTDRLECRLSRSQIQVVELTSMIRDAKEQIEFLMTQLYEAELDMSSCFSALADVPSTLLLWSSSFDSVYYAINEEFAEWRSAIQTVDARSSELASDFYHMAFEELLLAHSVIDKELQSEQLTSRQQAADLSSALASHKAIAACLEITQREQCATEGRLKTATDLTEKLKSSSHSVACQLSETEEKMRLAAAASSVALQKEKDTVQKLTSIVQKSRMAEDALRSEIEVYVFHSSLAPCFILLLLYRLTTELTNVEKYQEAYYSLSGEVGSLVARNQLAEDEAQRLSKFNAEILSHNNPAQRIMYVDRIRRELAETKHVRYILF